jgi:hypothetical protein
MKTIYKSELLIKSILKIEQLKIEVQIEKVNRNIC